MSVSTKYTVPMQTDSTTPRKKTRKSSRKRELFDYRLSQLGFSRMRTPAAMPSAAYIVMTDEPP